MVGKISIRTLAICTFALLALGVANAQDHRQSEARKTQKQQPGLLDFALAGANSEDRDYGQCFSEARQLLIHETVERAYFWSNLCSITVALFLLIVVVHQRQCHARFEKQTSEAIAQYHNALERASAQIRQATDRNHALMQALSIPRANNIAAPESDLVPQRRTAGRPPRDNATPTAKVTAQTKADEPSKNLTMSAMVPTPPQATAVHEERSKVVTQANANQTGTKAVQDKSKPLDQMGLFGSDVELISRINVIQQQLSSSQEREKHLRRQLNDSELRLQKEQQKSRMLQS